MTEFKKKPLLYKFKEFYTEHLCDYTHGFVAFKWWFRFKIYLHNIFFPYNVVKIDSLPRTYSDKDFILLHANFQILSNFFEKEMSNSTYGFISDLNEIRKDFSGLYDKDKLEEVMIQEEKYNNEKIELMKIYFWWRSDRPYRELKSPKMPENIVREEPFGEAVEFDEYGDPKLYKYNSPSDPRYLDWLKACGEFEAACEKEDDEKLVRLVQLRRHLWT